MILLFKFIIKCPSGFPIEFYCYGTKRAKPGRLSKQLQKQLALVDTQFRQLTSTNDEANVDQSEHQNNSSVNETDTIAFTPEGTLTDR